MKRQTEIVAIIFLIVLVNSCKHERPYLKRQAIIGDTVDEKYESYDASGNLTRVYHQKNGLMHGFEREFYSNGEKKVEGSWYEGKCLGWFKYYSENGDLQTMRQYVLVNDEANWTKDAAYLNQVIRFARDGDTVKEGGFFIRVYTSGDTINNGETHAFKIRLVAPLFKNMIVILCDFDGHYGLLPNAVCDTFGVENYERAFSPKQYNKGENLIRGKVVNFENYIDSAGVSRQHIATIYFTDKFYVRQ